LETEAQQREEKKMKSSRKQQKQQLKNPRINGNRRQKQLSTKRRTTSNDNERCKICKRKFGNANDPKIGDDWIKCIQCFSWFHNSCGQANGILDDGDNFTCSDCV
jgi:hypothetical protein